MLSANDIRNQFLEFFKSKGHEIVPSAPIVVKNDPTLLFTNAGMNQFKDYFLGNRKAENTRVADTQKCLRVSGKHNDLEEVGVDTYHHTMFEMLGNWSFGDYFKKEAIAWSWELLTAVYKIPVDKLYVTVFQGDEKESLPFDEEAYNEWKKWIPEERILKGNKKDNFWEMGDTGPCGPSSEIHVDCRTAEERAAVDGKTLVNNDHPQVIEIWNNVFMEFNRLKDSSLQPLPAKHVDTGMGFERLVRVLQNKTSNYDSDIFTGTIAATEVITGKKYDYSDSKEAVAFRVLADHIRAISFTIADGQLPSNTGAGYVIRRILRRAVRYYYSYLDYKTPLLFQLVPLLAKQFEHVFPELYKQGDFVTKVVKEEEDAFLRTLARGISRFKSYITSVTVFGNGVFIMDDPFAEPGDVVELKNKYNDKIKKNILAGEVAFELYDTYGFPVDLTELMAKEEGWSVDMPGFEAEMKKQKDRSRAATALDTEDWVVLQDTDKNTFIGYDCLEAIATVVKYRKVKAKGKESFQIVLDRSPFYAESGGQVGDTGELIFPNESVQVIDTKKENNLIIHVTEVLPESLTGSVLAKVDAERRKDITAHHSATHLLHAALRQVLGTHVAQKGSLNQEEALRFDFSHFAKMTDEEIAATEHLVNTKIRENIPVVIQSMSKDEAVAFGAMALFGEKYGDVVRVVIMDKDYSVELCGGTHIGATGELGIFKIAHESAVAAGVRRIEAVTGKAAEHYINEQLEELKAARTLVKNAKDLPKSIENLQAELTEQRKKLESIETKMLGGIAKELATQAVTINDSVFIGATVEVSSADGLKKLALDLVKDYNVSLAVISGNIASKASVAIALSDAAIAKGLDAGKLIKDKVAPLIKGGGGGQKTLATAGGQDVSRLGEVAEVLKGVL